MTIPTAAVQLGVLPQWLASEFLPGEQATSADSIRDTVRQWGQTLYHPVGTCAMGVSDASVVDLECRVRGVDALRVVDASVMPTVPRGNTNAPTIAIAEKAADLILRRSPAKV